MPKEAMQYKQLTKGDEPVMNPLETVKLVEVTVVLAIETYSTESVAVCGMDYLDVPKGSEAQVIGWSERELVAIPAPEAKQ